MNTSARWRSAFILSALLLMIGGPQHPDGTMVEMLGHPDWIPAHTLMLAGFGVLLVGLLAFSTTPTLPTRARRWTRYALVGNALMIVEMALHTAAVVDYENLVAGNATPVLTAHLAAAVIFYPAFSATMVGLIIAAGKDNVLGSTWISWLGVVGLVGNGVAPALVLSGFEDARYLFRLLMLFAVWLILAGIWRLESSKAGKASDAVAPS